jgi:hypothetical protein
VLAAAGKQCLQGPKLLLAALCMPLCAHAGGLANQVLQRAPASAAVHAAGHALQLPSPRLAVLDAQREGQLKTASTNFRAAPQALNLDTDAAAEAATRTAFPIRWQSTPLNVSPEVVHIAKHFRHEGLPLVRLWQSGRNLLHIGLNGHGMPGVWFTQRGAD